MKKIRTIRILVIGDVGVGKTSLIKAFLGQNVKTKN